MNFSIYKRAEHRLYIVLALTLSVKIDILSFKSDIKVHPMKEEPRFGHSGDW